MLYIIFHYICSMDKIKIIRGYNFRYGVTRTGNVVSFASGKATKIGNKVRPDGYMQAFLLNRKYMHHKNCYVHRLVAQNFVPNPLGLPEVNHKDKNRSNNHADNLEWCTHQYNIQHSYADGTRAAKIPKGVNHWFYGVKKSATTKQQMSDKKKGVLHPKFKGWYVVDGVKYATPSEAETATGIKAKKVWAMCTGRTFSENCNFEPI